MAYSESAQYKAYREREIAEGRRFYVLVTLLGGKPDVNRRCIADHANPEWPGERWNEQMGEWTPELETALQVRLRDLNGRRLP